MRHILFLALIVLVFSSCSENYSNGERIGVITQFSNTGRFWKSHEGHLNVTQTGMNTANGFDFSLDNDNEPKDIIPILDSAAQHGWKVKVTYHEVAGYNWFNNRGNTDHFVTKVEVLEKNFGNMFNGQSQDDSQRRGRVVDTIYVVIVPKPQK